MFAKALFKSFFVVVFSLVISSTVFAACVRTGVSQTEDGRTALIPYGNFELRDLQFQPAGTHLGSVLVPSTNYTYGGANADSILWYCNPEDLPNIYFLVAVNGDDRVGGFWEMTEPGVPEGVYATWFTYVGIRQTMNDVLLTRFWKAVPVTSYLEENGRINIRLRDIPPIQADFYRLSALPPSSGSASHYCSGVTVGRISGMGGATEAGTPYNCTQPNSYIQLVGPGLVSDQVGEDSAYHWDFWGVDNGFGYGMRTANTLTGSTSCSIQSSTTSVDFGRVTLATLADGGGVSMPVSVQVFCSNQAVLGTSSGQWALSFEASPGALAAAKSISGMVNSSGGITALLSDNYLTDNNLAKGVAVYLTQPSGQTMLFSSLDKTNRGNNAGWYNPTMNQQPSSDSGGFLTYDLEFTATLKRYAAREALSPGLYSATATIVVKMQ